MACQSRNPPLSQSMSSSAPDLARTYRICITTHTISAIAITAMMAIVIPKFFVELVLTVSTTTRRPWDSSGSGMRSGVSNGSATVELA